MIGDFGIQQRIKSDPLTQEEYYLIGAMFNLAHLRMGGDADKFRVMDFLIDPVTPEEHAAVKRAYDKAYGENWKPDTEVYWSEDENAPISCEGVRHVFYALKREALRLKLLESLDSELMRQLEAIEIPMHSVTDLRAAIKKAKKDIEDAWDMPSLASLFSEPEGFMRTKGNFASMDRKRFYKQNHDPKQKRMAQHRNFRRKM